MSILVLSLVVAFLSGIIFTLYMILKGLVNKKKK